MPSKIPHYADSVSSPTAGCTGCELWSPTCKTCDAGDEHERYGSRRLGYSPDFEQVTYRLGDVMKAACLPDLRWLRRDEKPWLDGMPRMILLSNLGDALCDPVPFGYLRKEIVDVVTSLHGSRHVWLWPTKWPNRMIDFSVWLKDQGLVWPRNLAVGTSITNAETLGRIAELLQVGGEETRRFVCVEPQLGTLNIRPWLPRINWVVQGGECGWQSRRFDLAWAEEMRRHCQEAGVAYFLNRLGGYVFDGSNRIRLHDRNGANWNEWPDTLKTREVPVLWGDAARTELSGLPASND